MKRSLLTLAGFAFAAASQAVVINEIRIDQPSADNQEYFELFGTAGESLNDLTYIVIGDGTGASGVIESVTSLAGLSVNLNGYFLVAEATWGTSVPPGFAGGVPDLSLAGNGLNFENSDNVTHLLVSGFTGASGDDLDTNDDGTLDTTPWSGIVDSVALVVDPTATTSEHYYSPNVVGPDGIFVPGHVYRFGDGGPWTIGLFGNDGIYEDTPGGANPVPEPATMSALALGAMAMIRRRAR